MTNVLIVDDSAIDRTLVAGILKKDHRLCIRSATDGADALAQLSDHPVDVVVTDLQMPELDGIQLVTAIRIHYPGIPVILVTAHGSEELAIQALEQGAASYVPKSQLAERLVDTVEHVLALAKAERSYELLTACMGKAEFEFAIDNELTLLDRLVEFVQEIVVSMEVCDVGGQVRLGMALEEALRCASFRGNLELEGDELHQIMLHRDGWQDLINGRRALPQYANRKLNISVRITPDAAHFVIEHSGPPLRLQLSETATHLEDDTERSLILMKAFMDEVQFSSDGRRIELTKRRQT